MCFRKVQEKGKKLLSTAEQQDKATKMFRAALSNATSLEEIDVLGQPFKTGSKATLAARAAKAGLEEAAMDLMNNTREVHFGQLVDKVKEKWLNSTVPETELLLSENRRSEKPL